MWIARAARGLHVPLRHDAWQHDSSQKEAAEQERFRYRLIAEGIPPSIDRRRARRCRSLAGDAGTERTQGRSPRDTGLLLVVTQWPIPRPAPTLPPPGRYKGAPGTHVEEQELCKLGAVHVQEGVVEGAQQRGEDAVQLAQRVAPADVPYHQLHHAVQLVRGLVHGERRPACAREPQRQGPGPEPSSTQGVVGGSKRASKRLSHAQARTLLAACLWTGKRPNVPTHPKLYALNHRSPLALVLLLTQSPALTLRPWRPRTKHSAGACAAGVQRPARGRRT